MNLDELKQKENELFEIKNHLAYNSNDQDVLKYLLEDVSILIRYNVARNPDATKEILLDMIDNNNILKVIKGIFENINFDLEVLNKLYSLNDRDINYIISQDPLTPVDLIKELYEKNDTFFHYGLASNPNTPKEILEQLYRINYPNYNEFNQKLASNTNTPEYILKDLAINGDCLTKIEITMNESSTQEILEILKDFDKEKELEKYYSPFIEKV